MKTPTANRSLPSAARRHSCWRRWSCWAACWPPPRRRRSTLSSISRADATAGVKAALEKGSAAAVASLGVEDGFLGNPAVRIPLPDGLKQAERLMKLMGRQQEFDALVVSINRAAEAAIPQAKPLLMSAIQFDDGDRRQGHPRRR